MDYKEAVKLVQSKKQKDNMIMVNVGYKKYLLPYKDGMAFMAAMVNAEILDDPYSGIHRITPINKDDITTSLYSAEEYERVKVCALLNISQAEFAEYANK